MSCLSLDESFEVWWCQESMVHSPDKERVLREAYRVLKPGGRAVISDHIFWHERLAREERAAVEARYGMTNLSSPADYERHIEAAGLRLVEHRDWQRHAAHHRAKVLARLEQHMDEFAREMDRETLANNHRSWAHWADLAAEGKLSLDFVSRRKAGRVGRRSEHDSPNQEEPMDHHLENAIARIPHLAGRSAEALAAERLGGMTNLVYRLNDDGESLVLRIPGEGTEAYIDRSVEAHNTRAAARAGVGAEVLHFDESDGLMLMRNLDGCRTMSPEAFQAEDAAADRAARGACAHAQLPARAFRFRFELFAMIDEYHAGALRAGYRVAGGLPRCLGGGPGDARGAGRAARDPGAVSLRSAVRELPRRWEPHVGGRLGVLGHERPVVGRGRLRRRGGPVARPGRAARPSLPGPRPERGRVGRMVLYKAASDLLWTLWGLIQRGNGNPAEDFWAYSIERFERCKALMGAPEFPRHVAAVRRGG
ncbi:MAG: methyltransferase domain-containing protein [Arhodomonas sp.]|nr:methyltransferase domain-containing protein [Arhodomonas sp.]